MKSFLIILLALIIIGSGYYWFNGRTERVDTEYPVSTEEEMEVSQTVTVSGVVLSVDREAITYDGPAYVVIDVLDGSQVTVAVPSMGLGLCEAREDILDVYTLTPGTKVEVRGALGEDGYIVPCQSADHFLRLGQ